MIEVSSNYKVPQSAHVELKSEWQPIMTEKRTVKIADLHQMPDACQPQ